MNIFDIANGHVKELFNLNEELSKNRLKICYSCPIYSPKLGGVCSSKLYLNPNTGDVSEEPKDGYVRGCSCRLRSKTRIPEARCIAGKW